MKLVTKQIRRILPSLSSQDGDGSDAMAYLKLFTPDSGFTWYITSGSQEGDDFMMFGLVDGLEKELGYVSLKELESVRGPMGLPLSWTYVRRGKRTIVDQPFNCIRADLQ